MSLSVSEKQQLLRVLPPKYTDTFPLYSRIAGVVAFALVAVAITAFALTCTNHFTTLPHDFVHLFTHANLINTAIGVGVTTVVIEGVGFIIYRARTTKDFLVNNPIFQRSDASHYIEEGVTENEWRDRAVVYIDTSTLNAEGSGKAYLYAVKGCADHYFVTSAILLSTPIYTVFSVAYHTLRMCVVPFYLLVRLAGERCFSDQRRYQLLDVVKEPLISLQHVVKAPFYGTAFFFAGLYGLVNPMGGRILGSKIERDWNNGASRAEGYWSVGGPQPLLDWGHKLDLNFYLAGCWQPVGVAQYEKGDVVEASSLSKAINSQRGHVYQLYPRSLLEGKDS